MENNLERDPLNVLILTTTSSMILYHKSIVIYPNVLHYTVEQAMYMSCMVAIVNCTHVEISTCHTLLLLLAVIMQILLYTK